MARSEEVRAQKMDKAKEKFDAARLRQSRVLLGGNAGGVIATLTLIGASLRRSEAVVPTEIFWVLVCFVVGLISNWAMVRVDTIISNEELRAIETKKAFGGNVRTRLELIDRLGRIVAATAFLVGLCGGLIQIYRLTS